MAEFCYDCTKQYFQESENDFIGLCGENQTTTVLCEGCGEYIEVNSKGQRVLTIENHNPTLQDFIPYVLGYRSKNIPIRICLTKEQSNSLLNSPIDKIGGIGFYNQEVINKMIEEKILILYGNKYRFTVVE